MHGMTDTQVKTRFVQLLIAFAASKYQPHSARGERSVFHLCAGGNADENERVMFVDWCS